MACCPLARGSQRELGVPTALDRRIQQAISQTLTAICDSGFSERRFGFRPGRSAHDAIERARRDIAEGYEWAGDLDLDRFFDRVNQDRLMARLADQDPQRVVTDPRRIIGGRRQRRPPSSPTSSGR